MPERDLPEVLRAVAVPVAAHRHISASGSINTWIALGRRPIVLTGTTRASSRTRMPGVVTLVEDAAGLATAIGARCESPEQHLGRRRRPCSAPTWADSALAHEAVLRSVS